MLEFSNYLITISNWHRYS